ncbi:MAG TPA: hypothetical protein VGP92_10455 [Acidimicrobiia bacterium]|nr:hypothetical protein [Acidimicrobiia bacterium]
MPAVALIVCCFIARGGYTSAVQCKRKYGRAGWGAEPLFWGIFCFLLGLIGLLIQHFAEKSVKKHYRPVSSSPPAYVQSQRYAPRPVESASAGQWGPPPAQWAPPPSPGPVGPPRPNVGGSDFLPHR